MIPLLKLAQSRAKKSTPCQLSGESREEYRILLIENTRLEFADILRNLAQRIEDNTMARTKRAIDVLYEDLTIDKK